MKRLFPNTVTKLYPPNSARWRGQHFKLHRRGRLRGRDRLEPEKFHTAMITKWYKCSFRGGGVLSGFFSGLLHLFFPLVLFRALRVACFPKLATLPKVMTFSCVVICILFECRTNFQEWETANATCLLMTFFFSLSD